MALGFPRHCWLQNQMWYKIASPLISSRGFDLLQAQPNHPNPSHDQHRFWIYCLGMFSEFRWFDWKLTAKYQARIHPTSKHKLFGTPGNSSNSFRAAAVLVAHSMTSNEQKPSLQKTWGLEVKMLCYDSAKLEPSREVTYTTYGKGNSSSQPTWEGKC